jgi:uncharacterized protein YeaO (DUF488 family)
MAYELRIKRVYDPASEDDGKRILVDRLWPRGISKERARLDEWNKDITPSPELRKWFGHKEENFDRFKELYTAELDNNKTAPAFLKELSQDLKEGNVTLLYGAKSPSCNHAVILLDWLQAHITPAPRQ